MSRVRFRSQQQGSKTAAAAAATPQRRSFHRDLQKTAAPRISTSKSARSSRSGHTHLLSGIKESCGFNCVSAANLFGFGGFGRGREPHPTVVSCWMRPPGGRGGAGAACQPRCHHPKRRRSFSLILPQRRDGDGGGGRSAAASQLRDTSGFFTLPKCGQKQQPESVDCCP